MLHSFEQLAHTKCTNAQMHKCTICLEKIWKYKIFPLPLQDK
jgi:hypothetical protein